MPRYMAFDLETVDPFPEDRNWREVRPLGIGCAAAYASDLRAPIFWCERNEQGGVEERMSRASLQGLVRTLAQLTAPDPRAPQWEPYTLLTWNGLGFDFDILAEESGLQDECRHMALNHADMMFHIYAKLGHPLGLAKAAKGMGTPGKAEGMDGAIANEMWRNGDRVPVIEYCGQDVRSTLALAEACVEQGHLGWTSNRGNLRVFPVETRWMLVREAMDEPRPDTSWMTDPLPPENFTGWLYRQDARRALTGEHSSERSSADL